MAYSVLRKLVLICGLIGAVLTVWTLHIWNKEYADLHKIYRPENSGSRYMGEDGIPVIVGHYVGNAGNGVSLRNLTDEFLNENHFNPVPNEGEDGRPVVLKPHERIKGKELFLVNQFNLLASDKISLDRKLSDIRKQACLDKSYNLSSLPSTSVVIVFHNEAWSTLLRTVHSVISRSPLALLKEIILVDDASTRAFLRAPLEDHVSKLSVPARVLRSKERIGLIKARLIGARNATGDVLTFLDAHCETTPGWLEPLLFRIKESPRSAVCPVIDIINDDTFALVRSVTMNFGAFNWGLNFRWFTAGEASLRERNMDPTQAFRTPVMAGGLFSIRRDYFFESGSYDEDMDIWGGENIEMSFRLWMCGGRVEISPCSHVAHVFRKQSPYTYPREGGVTSVLYGNLARVAIVWMDDWKEFFFKLNEEASRLRDRQAVRRRLQLREEMKCNGFDWYLKNVWPENFLPASDRFFGKVKHRDTGRCLEKIPGRSGAPQAAGKAKLSVCSQKNLYQHQLWVVTKEGYVMTDESVCLDVLPGDRAVHAWACTATSRQRWKYSEKDKTFLHVESHLCLAGTAKIEPGSLSVLPCDPSNPQQQWDLLDVSWH